MEDTIIQLVHCAISKINLFLLGTCISSLSFDALSISVCVYCVVFAHPPSARKLIFSSKDYVAKKNREHFDIQLTTAAPMTDEAGREQKQGGKIFALLLNYTHFKCPLLPPNDSRLQKSRSLDLQTQAFRNIPIVTGEGDLPNSINSLQFVEGVYI